MKHFLLLLTLLCSLAGYGQSTKKATFNFSYPSSLSPSYHDKDFTTDAGPAVKVSNVTFKSGDVSLSFTETGSALVSGLQRRTMDIGLNPRSTPRSYSLFQVALKLSQ